MYKDRFLVPTFKVGRRIVVPVPPILSKFGLGVADDDDQHEPPKLSLVKDG